jgi:hypothetical protein
VRGMIHVKRMLGLGTACLILLGCAPWARAAPGGLPAPAAHADSSPEWENLREKLFPSRAVDTTPGTVQIIAPLRAAYGASVPWTNTATCVLSPSCPTAGCTWIRAT